MKISIFEGVTTEEALIDIEEEAKRHEGLYVEMEDPDQRKYVKDKASLINGLLKKLDRARIDKSKSYKITIEKEAAKIKHRLKVANKPFTLLIDAHKIVREKELAKEKEIQAAKDLAFQIPIDHEEALSMNKLFDFEKAELVRVQKERDETIASEAAAKAKQQEIERQERETQAEADHLKKLSLDRGHVGAVRGQIKIKLMDHCGLDESTAKSVVKALLKISNVTINY